MFTPNVKVIMDEPTGPTPAPVQPADPYGARPRSQEEFDAMIRRQEGPSGSSFAFILIAAIVVLFIVGALVITKVVLNNNQQKMVRESNQIHRRIS